MRAPPATPRPCLGPVSPRGRNTRAGARRLLRRLRPEALDALEEDDEEIEEGVDPRVVERDAPERHRRTAGQRPRDPELEDRVDPHGREHSGGVDGGVAGPLEAEAVR